MCMNNNLLSFCIFLFGLFEQHGFRDHPGLCENVTIQGFSSSFDGKEKEQKQNSLCHENSCPGTRCSRGTGHNVSMPLFILDNGVHTL